MGGRCLINMILLLTTYSLAHKNQVWAAWWLLPLCNAIYASAGPEHGLGFSHHPPLLLLLYITLAGLAHSFLLRVWRGWICTCARLGWDVVWFCFKQHQGLHSCCPIALWGRYCWSYTLFPSNAKPTHVQRFSVCLQSKSKYIKVYAHTSATEI